MNNFLEQICYSHSIKNNIEAKSIFYQSLSEIGLGYLSILVKPSEIKKIGVDIK